MLRPAKEKLNCLNFLDEQGRVEDKEKTASVCNGCVAIMTLLQGLRYNSFCLSWSAMFTNKATIFLDDGLYRKISALYQGLLSQLKFSIDCNNFFVMATGH